jgi:group II intron reverse transcriptase/maturase
MTSASKLGNISTKQERIATLARQAPAMGFTSLNHLLDIEWLKEAYRRTRKDGATGVDGVTAEAYERDLEGNLGRLLNALKVGTYRAPPVRRVHIPKGDGSETRPIGIPTLEDKVAQRAVAMLLEPIYETDFYDVSYGFRPGRSAHDALAVLWKQSMATEGVWVLEVDIRKFFDTLDHRHLRELVQHRVRDGVVLRLIGKWLNAGVLEEGVRSVPEAGTPQGGVISPLLANIYLHEVLDLWFERVVQARLKGRSFLVRFADDFVMGFSSEEDARRVTAVLPKRFAKFGLAIHPEKTRLLFFGSPNNGRRPGSFNFLGFTHYWGMSRNGRWVIKRKTACERFTRALRSVRDWCRANRHRDVMEQAKALNRKLRGHYGFYGITGNIERLKAFRVAVERAWRFWLDRRSQRARMTWERFKALLARAALLKPRVVHSVYAAKP